AVADGEALRGLIERERVTVMQATPSTWRLLIAAGWKGSPTFRVFCGGEPLPPDLAAQMVERSGVVWNMYGPTETTIYSTRYALQKAPDRQDRYPHRQARRQYAALRPRPAHAAGPHRRGG
ncbi:MAG: AMP-binding protein, partial [Sandaracinaceae bacterium]|nr:AMP-binding protein [Sandaracinaceae bacterium]